MSRTCCSLALMAFPFQFPTAAAPRRMPHERVQRSPDGRVQARVLVPASRRLQITPATTSDFAVEGQRDRLDKMFYTVIVLSD